MGRPRPAPAPASTDAKRSWGSLVEGLNVFRDIHLGDRARAVEQLNVYPAAPSQMVSLVWDVLPEHEAAFLVSPVAAAGRPACRCGAQPRPVGTRSSGQGR